MKNIFFLLIFSLLTFSTLTAQQNNFKYWTEGPLNWEDFRGQYFTPGMDCELKYYLTHVTDKHKYDDTTLSRITAGCYIDKNLSWARPERQSFQLLEYNQVAFDIVELHRRKLQIQLDKTGILYMADEETRSIASKCEQMLSQFRHEAQQGIDYPAVIRWRHFIDNELNSSVENRIPAFTKRNFGYGMHIGFGPGFASGSLGEHLAPSANLIYGFDVAYKNATFFICATLGGSKAKADYYGRIGFSQDERVGIAIIDGSVGYAAINNTKIKLSPFAGIGALEFSKRNPTEPVTTKTMSKVVFLFGLNADYKIRKNVSLIPSQFLGMKEYSEFDVRARLYLDKCSFFA